MMGKIENYPRPAQDVVGKILDHEAVLVLTSKAQIKVVNEVGARIWRLADGSRSVAQIAEQICLEYDVHPEEALHDTLEFIDDLVERDILVLAETPSPRQKVTIIK
jgi:hypothetical protein